MEKIAFIDSPFGLMKAKLSQDSLLGFSFVNETDLNDCQDGIEFVEYNEEQSTIIEQLKEFVATYDCGATMVKIPIVLDLTDFQRKVLEEVEKIPYGKTVSYGALAKKVGVKSAQAVGQALAANPILLLIPCHRVIKADGGLGGYSGGIDRKQLLLEMEKEHVHFL